MRATEYDICIIGGGAAGLVAAAGATALGARTVLIEKNRLGGDCLYTGCVPSKALLHCARLAADIRRAGEFGLSAQLTAPDVARVLEYVSQVITAIAPHDSPERFRNLGVEVIESPARFAGPHSVAVGGREIRARRYVIATGSRPVIPPIPGLESVRYFTTADIFSLREPLPRLAVIGGGPTGVELAQAFARLGSRVAVFETAAQILPHEDADVAEVLAGQLHRDGVTLFTSAQVRRIVKRPDNSLTVYFTAGNNMEQQFPASHLLIAAGREPVLDGLDLEHAGVRVHDGRLQVDRRLRTSQRHIYACGDVIGPWRFTHMAEHQAGIVLRNALLHLRAQPAELLPFCIFTEPEVARAGWSEHEAYKKGAAHSVYKVPYTRADRAYTDGTTQGFVKLLLGRRGRLLGAVIVGAQAGELIHELTLAIRHKLKAGDLSACIHAYPTLSQLNRFAADEHLKRKLTPAARRWLQRLLRLRGAHA